MPSVAATTSFHGICSGNREIFGEVNERMEMVKSRMKGFRVPVFVLRALPK